MMAERGMGIDVENQTLSADSLYLTIKKKDNLIAFINSLNYKQQSKH
ncbi:MAG TPA: hypothetical protein VGI43_02435 [Mucilaginibacter sp.]